MLTKVRSFEGSNVYNKEWRLLWRRDEISNQCSEEERGSEGEYSPREEEFGGNREDESEIEAKTEKKGTLESEERG